MLPLRTLRPAVALAIALAAPLALGGAGSPDDEAAVRAAYEAYVDAWLANDREAVLATVAENVVLMPTSLAPVEGRAAAEAFWFPADGPATTVTAYESEIDQVRLAGDTAVVRARSIMTFTWEQDGEPAERTHRSMSLTVLERGADGRWRIAVRMWGRMRE